MIRSYKFCLNTSEIGKDPHFFGHLHSSGRHFLTILNLFFFIPQRSCNGYTQFFFLGGKESEFFHLHLTRAGFFSTFFPFFFFFFVSVWCWISMRIFTFHRAGLFRVLCVQNNLVQCELVAIWCSVSWSQGQKCTLKAVIDLLLQKSYE